MCWHTRMQRSLNKPLCKSGYCRSPAIPSLATDWIVIIITIMITITISIIISTINKNVTSSNKLKREEHQARSTACWQFLLRYGRLLLRATTCAFGFCIVFAYLYICICVFVQWHFLLWHGRLLLRATTCQMSRRALIAAPCTLQHLQQHWLAPVVGECCRCSTAQHL